MNVVYQNGVMYSRFESLCSEINSLWPHDPNDLSNWLHIKELINERDSIEKKLIDNGFFKFKQMSII